MKPSYNELLRKYEERSATIKKLKNALKKTKAERNWLRRQSFEQITKTGESK